ncbi:MAG: fatty acid hydroxylase, partial [Methylovulum sp.]|nr:fatty acid hydroxylase [Methylovulum sp.]
MNPANPLPLAEASQHSGFLFNEMLFGLAMVAFAVLMVMERVQPYRKFTNKISKESFVTNTTAFLFNNIILTVLRASSLFFIAQRFSSFGLLSDLGNGP